MRCVERAGKQSRIATYRISDWLVPTDHMQLDRGMPGDGVIDLAEFDRKVTDAGCDGPLEVEIFSESLWKMEPGAFLSELKRRCEEICPGSEGGLPDGCRNRTFAKTIGWGVSPVRT